LNKEEDFEKQAKEFSIEQETKDNGGKIEIDISRGSYIPVIGEYKELNDKIFVADAGEVLAEPFKTDKGWQVVKVREKYPERQKSFDEVRQQVITALLSQKRRDVQADLIEKMMDKYNVIVHTSVLEGVEETATGDKAK